MNVKFFIPLLMFVGTFEISGTLHEKLAASQEAIACIKREVSGDTIEPMINQLNMNNNLCCEAEVE